MSRRVSPIADDETLSAKLPISALAGEMPGRAEGGVTELGVDRALLDRPLVSGTLRNTAQLLRIPEHFPV